MPYRPAFSLALLLAALSGISSCKRDDSAPEGPACPARDSRLVSKTIRYQSRDTTITFTDGGLRGLMVAAGPDSVIERISAAQTNYYIFSEAGDHVHTHQLFTPGGSSGSYHVDFYYVYDAEHHLTKSWTQVWTPTFAPGYGLQDSNAYIWQDGNLTEMQDLLRNERMLYTYGSDGRGQNPDNAPEVASRWLYRPGSRVVLSKDYVRTIGTGSSAEPRFDQQGRLIALRVTDRDGGFYSDNTYVYTCK